MTFYKKILLFNVLKISITRERNLFTSMVDLPDLCNNAF